MVESEELAAIRLGPGVALVDHHADVRVSAAIGIRGQLLRLLPAAGGVEVIVIRDGIEPVIDRRVRRSGLSPCRCEPVMRCQRCPVTVLMKKHSPLASQSCPHGFVVPWVSTSTIFRSG